MFWRMAVDGASELEQLLCYYYKLHQTINYSTQTPTVSHNECILTYLRKKKNALIQDSGQCQVLGYVVQLGREQQVRHYEP